MVSTRWLNILLIYIVGKVISNVSITRQTTIEWSAKTTYSSTKLPRKVISRLCSLRADVAQYVATYSIPPHFVSMGLYKFRRHKQVPKKGWTKVTKSTSRIRYVKRRTYPSHADRRKSIFDYLLNVFSLFNNTMKEQIVSINQTSLKKSPCYLEAYSAFMKYCYYGYFIDGGTAEVKTLLARACSVKWMSAKRVVHILETCCKSRFKFRLFNYRP